VSLGRSGIQANAGVATTLHDQRAVLRGRAVVQQGTSGAVRWARPSGLESGIVLTRELSDLRLIQGEKVSAVVVQRNLPRALRQLGAAVPDPGFCRMVPLGQGFDARALLGNEFLAAVSAALAREFVLLHRALRAVDGGRGHAQLAVVAGDECRKFHVDYYRLRLLVTYLGPGTEIAPECGLDRGELATRGDDVEAANRALLSPITPPFRTAAGHVVLLKGARWGSGLAAVHRSPPIVSTREVRLVLKLTVE
jgi:hypothetical protein